MVNTNSFVSSSYSDDVKKTLEIIDRAISALKLCNENTNYREEIGIFVREMPKLNYLSVREFVHCIRMVCTGELETTTAIKLLEGIKSHLQKATKPFL